MSEYFSLRIFLWTQIRPDGLIFDPYQGELKVLENSKVLQNIGITFGSRHSSYGSYAKYVGTKFEREPFKAGGKCTHEALRRVRQYDLRGGRTGTDKFVMVFTDGASQDPSRTASEARSLQNSGEFSN